ncbi:MAG: serine/threonine protein kinase [Planctomycetota bacterium]|nr:MAG: serine/threonine protein kinase [Planctomycetota bacterium]
MCEATPPTVPAPSVSKRLPRSLGACTIRKRIGKGGRSHVFAARQAVVGRLVALKVLRPEMAVQPQAVAAFRAEAAAYGRYDHPHILTCHAAGNDGDWHYMALSHAARGDSLRALRGCSRAQLLRRVLPWMAQIADAVAHLDDHGVLHGDIKPANILITADDRALLADLGSLQAKEQAATARRWEGTPGYMSPEHANRQGQSVRSDIFALGATAWHLCAGRAPRPATGDQHELLRQAVHEPLPSLATVAPWVPSSVVAVIERCVHPDDSQRYSSPREVARNLRQVAESLQPETPDQQNYSAINLSLGF